MYVSASSLTGYLQCPTKAVHEAMGCRRPYNEAFKRGHDLHSAVEAYLKGDTPSINDPLAIHALHLLPAPRTRGVFVELGLGMPNADSERYARTEHFTGMEDTAGGAVVRGIVDLVRTDRGILEIIDHKTCADFWFAETPESLPYNLQLNLYADHVARWIGYEGPVRLTHIQYNKRHKVPGPESIREVSCMTDTNMLRSRRRMIDRIAAAFVRDVARAQLTRTQHNPSSCGMYGGCHLADLCATIRHPKRAPVQEDLATHWRLTVATTEPFC